jgi:acyl carrier protein
MKNNIENRVREVMSAVFGVSEDKVSDETSPDTISSWDSLQHMNLVAAIEEEFKIELLDDDVLSMQNFKLIVTIIAEGNYDEQSK